MKLIPLTQGKFTQVDDEIFEYLNQWKWYALKAESGVFYAVRGVAVHGHSSYKIRMHHLVVGVTRLPQKLGLEIDHIDGEGLNNQRANLRVVSSRGNNQNRKCHRDGAKLVGARYEKRNKFNPWGSAIWIDGKKKMLGYYATEQEAHDRYLQEIKIRGL